MPAGLAGAFAVGLLGSAHCVGMCGGFVALLGVGGGPRDGARVAARQTAYLAGKTATYMVFGAVAGAAGGLLTGALAGAAGAVSLALGALLVAAGLALCGVAWGGGQAIGARLAGRLSPAIGRLAGHPHPAALVGLGALNGLVPCGLVYGMLAHAATTGGAATGALTMGAFGLGTVPALALAGVFGARMRPERRLTVQRLAGVLMIAMGLLTAARGAQALAAPPDAPPEATVCHTPPR